MKKINEYIQTAIVRGENHKHRTETYPFPDEQLILVRKTEEDFEELKKRIKICKDKGVSIPEYFDYKYDNGYYWILEELAPGQEFEYLVKNQDITEMFAHMPYEHISKYIHDVYLLETNGIGVEPRRRNIFYDRKKGFTTIDVALFNDNGKNDSLEVTNYFFKMFSPVFVLPFKDDEHSHEVEKKTTLNVMKAFETGHPFFNKYKRWIYRGSNYHSKILKDNNVDLNLDDQEHQELIVFINNLIENIVNERLDNPQKLYGEHHIGYTDLLSSSIAYCPNFKLFDTTKQTLEEYINNMANNKIKELFLNNQDDEKLRELYFMIRSQELDPVHIYPQEYIHKKIELEINNENGKTR